MAIKKYPTFIYSTLGEKRINKIWAEVLSYGKYGKPAFEREACKLLSKEFGVPYVVTGGSPGQPVSIYRVNIT